MVHLSFIAMLWYVVYIITVYNTYCKFTCCKKNTIGLQQAQIVWWYCAYFSSILKTHRSTLWDYLERFNRVSNGTLEGKPLTFGFMKDSWWVVSTYLKNIGQIGSFPQVGMNIKNLWNHQVGLLYLDLWRVESATVKWPFSQKAFCHFQRGL